MEFYYANTHIQTEVNGLLSTLVTPLRADIS